MKSKKTVKTKKPEYRVVVETFRPPLWEMERDVQKEPSAFNGNVRVEKYRITIEKIEEPIEVIHERLEKLWRECDNWHHWTPLENTAKRFGYTFKSKCGCDVKKKAI